MSAPGVRQRFAFVSSPAFPRRCFAAGVLSVIAGLVLNGVLYPSGSAIPAGAPSAAAEASRVAAHDETPSEPVAASRLPEVANRPVRDSGGVPPVVTSRDRPQ